VSARTIDARHHGAVAAAIVVPVAAALVLTPLAAHPVWLAASVAAALAALALAWTIHRHGVATVWIAALTGSILLGGLGAVSVGGQNGRLLWTDLVLAIGLGAAIAGSRFAPRVTRTPSLDALALAIAWSALTLGTARDLLTGLAELKEWLVMLGAAACALAWTRDGARARRLLGMVAVTGTLVATHMIVVAMTSPLGPVLAVLMKQVDLPWGRTNYLAGILVLALPVTLGLMGHASRAGARVAWLVLALVQVTGLLLSASKGAMLALALGLLVAYARGGKGSRVTALVLLAVAAAAVAIFELTPLHRVLAYRLQATALDYSAGERMDLYRLAFEAFVRHPVLGVGLNNFSVLANRLRGVDTVPHNLELGFLAELGLPGLVLVLAWLARCGADAWRARACAATPRERALGVALWAAFLTAVLHNQVESTLYGEQYKVVFALVAVATWRLAREASCTAHAGLRLAAPAGARAKFARGGASP
jgi:O-antigen ligase